MRENGRTFGAGGGRAEAAQAAPPAPRPAAEPGRACWRLDNLACHAALTLNLILVAAWVLPSALEVTAAARAERLERQEAERVVAESRQRMITRQATLEHSQDRTRKIAEENLRLATEINERLRKAKGE